MSEAWRMMAVCINSSQVDDGPFAVAVGGAAGLTGP